MWYSPRGERRAPCRRATLDPHPSPPLALSGVPSKTPPFMIMGVAATGEAWSERAGSPSPATVGARREAADLILSLA